MTSTAIPRSLNLGATKPTTIPAYSRRVESIATNAQTFTENGIANIVLDTSTPGSFLDPTQSLLQFDIQITNTNPYIDFINLSTGGISSIIQEMRIICQGTPIEEMLDYNLMFEMFMDLGGHAQEEFKMYMENSWRAPVAPGQSDLNFVKPPMVDREGVIMCPTPINQFGDAAFGTHTEDGNYKTVTSDIVGATNAGYTLSQVGSATGNITTALYDTSLGVNAATNGTVMLATGPQYPTLGGFDTKTVDYLHTWLPSDSRWTGCSAPGTVRSSTWTNRIDNTYVTWPSTVRPEPLYKNEGRIRMEADARKYRVQDYLNYLANVKNIPVGIAPSKSFVAADTFLNHGLNASGETAPASWNFNTISNHMTGQSTSINFTVSLPIFSGVLGLWAEKQFPTMLISPGSFYIQLKFAKAQHAFQCAMDPCRRIFGTYRDYVCNAGLPNYFQTEQNGRYLDKSGSAVSAFNTMAIVGNTTNVLPSSTWLAYTNAGTTGNDFAWSNVMRLNNPLVFNPTANTVASAAVTNGNLFYASDGNWGLSTGNAKPQYIPRTNPWVTGGTAFWNTSSTSNNVSVTTTSGTSVPTLERNTCYGTYLPCSTPQVRRTRNNENTYVSMLNSYADAYPNYTITNLRYVGVQTILPDEVTASIVRAAASSDISLHAQSVRTYRTLLAQSQNQSLILPIKVASANSLWVIFQNQNMIENTHYLSSSRTCPFSSYQFTTDSARAVGSQNKPTVQNVIAQNPFSIQLRIGNELMPQQPITSLQQVMTELMRSIHGLGDMNTNLQFMNSLRSNRFTDNSATTGFITASTEYNCLKSGDFTVPYVPVVALDDQTITNNPLFQDYLTLGDTTYDKFNDRGAYCFNEFLPPLSKFLLGFDLDTFPNTNDTARSGRYLGNAPLTLQMTNVYAASTPSIKGTSQDTLIATAVVLHDIRFSIMAGGQVLAYY